MSSYTLPFPPLSLYTLSNLNNIINSYVAHDNLEIVSKDSKECRPINNPMMNQYFSTSYDPIYKNYLPNSKLRFIYPGVNYHTLSPHTSQDEYEQNLKMKNNNNKSLSSIDSSSSSLKAKMSKLSSRESLKLFKKQGKTFNEEEDEDDEGFSDSELLANAAVRDEAEYSGFIGLSEALNHVLLSLDEKLSYSRCLYFIFFTLPPIISYFVVLWCFVILSYHILSLSLPHLSTPVLSLYNKFM